jgi:hypothetical protein
MATYTDEQKRERLAKMVGVAPDRLATIPGHMCTRIANALVSDDILFTKDLNWTRLMRVPNLGARGVNYLCDLLDLPRHQSTEEPLLPPNEYDGVIGTVLDLKALLASHEHTSSYFDVSEATSPRSFMLKSRKGRLFRVHVERID